MVLILNRIPCGEKFIKNKSNNLIVIFKHGKILALKLKIIYYYLII